MMTVAQTDKSCKTFIVAVGWMDTNTSPIPPYLLATYNHGSSLSSDREKGL